MTKPQVDNRSWYNRVLAPRLVHGACSMGLITAQRKRVVPKATGIVVEIGIGSGLNLPFYDANKVTRLVGVDPDATLLAIGEDRIAATRFDVKILQTGAENMPLDDNFADTVLVTYTFCTIPEAAKALGEVRRVLKPGGQLLFCEHGLSSSRGTAKWQNRINPIWKKLAGGCHLNRNMTVMLQDAGFVIEHIENFKLPGTPGIVGFHYLGTARTR